MLLPARLLCPSMLLALAACGPASDPAKVPSVASAPVTAEGATPPTGATAPTGGKLELTGHFEIAGTRWGEASTTLYFDDVALSMENERVIHVNGRGTPMVDSAIDAIESIQVETDSPEGKRTIEACSTGCTMDATIIEQSRGEWSLQALRTATPLPESTPLEVGNKDPRRKALLDALRPHIEADLGQPLIFQVQTLREHNGSAFAVVHPRTPAGKPIDFMKTRHAQRQADGVLDGDTVFALLQHRDGHWQVQEFVVGPTDVAWADWAQDYGAAKALFMLAE
jgi:hypothetical protein